jgi:hypothetical protein
VLVPVEPEPEPAPTEPLGVLVSVPVEPMGAPAFGWGLAVAGIGKIGMELLRCAA